MALGSFTELKLRVPGSDCSHLLLAATPRSRGRVVVFQGRRWRRTPDPSAGVPNTRAGLEHGPPGVVLPADLGFMRCPVHLLQLSYGAESDMIAYGV